MGVLCEKYLSIVDLIVYFRVKLSLNNVIEYLAKFRET